MVNKPASEALVEPLPRSSLIGVMDRTARLRPLLHVLSGVSRAFNALGIYRRHLPRLDLEELDGRTRAAMAGGMPESGSLDLYSAPLLDLRTLPSGSYFRDLLAMTGELPPFATIASPALAMLSRRSTCTDPAATRGALAKLPRCEVVELEAKHWIPTECPKEMREAIETWIANQVA